MGQRIRRAAAKGKAATRHGKKTGTNREKLYLRLCQIKKAGIYPAVLIVSENGEWDLIIDDSPKVEHLGK